MSAASESSFRIVRDEASGFAGMLWTIAAIAIVAAVLSLVGCAPTLTAQSAAPPGRAARLDEVTGFWGDVKSYRLEISQGVAIAVSCDRAGPCQQMSYGSDNREVAEVMRASLGTLQPVGIVNQGQIAPSARATAAALVIVGKHPGTTHVRVKAKGGERDVLVTVVAPPPQSPPSTVAR